MGGEGSGGGRGRFCGCGWFEGLLYCAVVEMSVKGGMGGKEA